MGQFGSQASTENIQIELLFIFSNFHGQKKSNCSVCTKKLIKDIINNEKFMNFGLKIGICTFLGKNRLKIEFSNLNAGLGMDF